MVLTLNRHKDFPERDYYAVRLVHVEMFAFLLAEDLTMDECKERCFKAYEDKPFKHIFYKNETGTSFPTQCLCFDGFFTLSGGQDGHFGCELILT